MSGVKNVSAASNLTQKQFGKTSRAVFLWLVLFGLEFDISLYGPITMRKLSFAMLVSVIVLSIGIPRVRTIKLSTLLLHMGMTGLGAYVFAIRSIRSDSLAIAGNSGLPVIQLLFQYIFLLPVPYLLSLVFQSAEEFCGVQLGVLTAQSLVAIIGRLCKPFRVFIFTNTAYGDGRMLNGVTSGIRVPIIGNVGAAGSWILFAGCIFCSYFLCKEKKLNAKYLLIYGMILVAMAFAGRTGLYFGIALLAVLLIYFSIHNFRKALKILVLITLLIVAAICYVLFVPDGYLKQATVRWVGEMILKGMGKGSTAEALRNMPIPPLNGETFWGTGIVGGVTASGIAVANDIGYVQTYAAWGISGCLAYYGIFFGYLAGCARTVKDKRIKRILMLFLMFIVIAEYKEPFLRKTPITMMFVSLAFIQMRLEENGKETIREHEATVSCGHHFDAYWNPIGELGWI